MSSSTLTTKKNYLVLKKKVDEQVRLKAKIKMMNRSVSGIRNKQTSKKASNPPK